VPSATPSPFAVFWEHWGLRHRATARSFTPENSPTCPVGNLAAPTDGRRRGASGPFGHGWPEHRCGRVIFNWRVPPHPSSLVTSPAGPIIAWMRSLGAPIVTFEEFDAARPPGRIVATSGGFDPIHPGHISSIQESRRFGDVVVVIVNGDAFLTAKKGRPFQDLETRCLIVSAIRGVDYVVPFEIEGDQTVREALRRLRPHVFTKGGDRVDRTSIPEWEICRTMGTEVVTGVGLEKRWSSSWFLDAWARPAL
jgi:cytidyltransferase-like protein